VRFVRGSDAGSADLFLKVFCEWATFVFSEGVTCFACKMEGEGTGEEGRASRTSAARALPLRLVLDDLGAMEVMFLRFYVLMLCGRERQSKLVVVVIIIYPTVHAVDCRITE
jgi:hypothetical protein